MRGWRTITSVVRTTCVSCSSLATALCVLRLSYVSQKTQTNRKENEHVENLLRQPCDLAFRTAVLRCCSQHREAAVRNQEICRRSKVHGCRKADVKQAYYRLPTLSVSPQFLLSVAQNKPASQHFSSMC